MFRKTSDGFRGFATRMAFVGHATFLAGFSLPCGWLVPRLGLHLRWARSILMDCRCGNFYQAPESRDRHAQSFRGVLGCRKSSFEQDFHLIRSYSETAMISSP